MIALSRQWIFAAACERCGANRSPRRTPAGALPPGHHLAGWVLTNFARTTCGGFCHIRTGLFDPYFPEILRVASCNLKGAPALISGGQKLTHSAWFWTNGPPQRFGCELGPLVQVETIGLKSLPLVRNRDRWSQIETIGPKGSNWRDLRVAV
jgi:hypothetical protein